ncbi:hypothetical protein [Massilia cavernae]|uniref:Uncharacterized protein n=1 Tax=Massilia cavernae TaxID=2320864 RepID=A0A418XQT2_9BURK|nr:hypothetical protein [Massilia cavernae]RJG14836.1 hypothetical protein D3872_16440 [Massilia cavernae]
MQRAFSVSVGSPNVEGLNIDSAPQTPATSINVLVADEFGNPVADVTSGPLVARQGSWHLLKVSAAAPVPCTADLRATFSVSITSPLGKLITTYPFTMPITCP